MAKMRIHEISKSLQAQGNDIKSSDLVKLLNENGFEVKGPNSNIEDAAIAFLLNEFQNGGAKKNDTAAPQKSANQSKSASKSKTDNKSENSTATNIESSENQSDNVSETETKKAQKAENAEQKAESEADSKTASKRGGSYTSNGNYSSESNAESNAGTNNSDSRSTGKNNGNKNYERSNDRNNDRGDRRNDRNDRGGNNRGNNNQGGNHGGYNRDNNRDYRDGRDNREGRDGRNRDNRDSRGGRGTGMSNGGGSRERQSGFKVIERFEKSQSGFDSIKQEQKPGRTQRSNKGNNKKDYGKKHGKDRFDYDMEETVKPSGKKKDPNRKGAFIKPEPVVKEEPEDTIRTIILPEKMTLKELGDKMKVPAAQIVKKLFLKGQMVSINQEISFEEAEEIALEYNCIAELEEKIDVIAELLKEAEEDEEKLVKRPPVVCVMGHVDHGKTSLLDAIRKTNVISREAGGITQHIGAYMVKSGGEKITFLDTPGHEAFTSMRMRGAKSTDIAILVVAADDGVMPQTVEAINHAKAAGVEIIVAVNKIDKPGANIERVKQELIEHELVAEDWGGSTVFVPVSAKTGDGISNLLEMILLTAEVCELKADPDRNARGIVIEAQLDKGRGPVATILVQKGTLHVGDHIVIGSCHGKVRAMIDDNGRRIKEAKPSTPVEILGLNDVPDAGEVFLTTDNEKEARTIVNAYIDQSKAKLIEDTKQTMSLDGLFDQIQAGKLKELNIIVKADVQGSVEAIKQSLLKLTNDEVAIRIIHGGVGAINESDVSLAIASSAIIIGFNVRPDNMAKATADREKVDLRLYKVIYDALADIEAAMKGLLDPIYEEKVIGHAEVRQTFKASGLGTIAGSYVLDGKIERGCKARIYRDEELIFEGNLASLKRFKDDVKEVATGYECGLVFDGFNDIHVEDKVELYIMVEIPR
ncbi:MAG: translation initiation factor IF-2 [Lachnospiraceae bacterium]|nr:translation initiation factor IF-2 [Lachnospiraceae bacterium]